MKYVFNLFILISLQWSCSNRGENTMDSIARNVEYFSNKDNSRFIRLFSKNDRLVLFEIDKNKNQIIKCVEVDSSPEKLLGCRAFYINYSKSIGNRHSADMLSFEINLNEFRNDLKFTDSVYYFNNLSILLDSSYLILPYDKDLLDFTYTETQVDQKILIKKLSLGNDYNSNNLGEIPTLFFDVQIDKEGKIISVEYNSWGSSSYMDLLPIIEKHLLNKVIKSYSVLCHSVSVKLKIGVVIE